MIRTSTVVRSLAISAVLALVVTLIVAGSVGAQGNLQHPPDPRFQGETGVPPDIDRRGAPRAPSAGQERLAADLGAQVRWNEYCPSRSLIRHGGFLSERIAGTPEAVAGAWLRDHAALFRLTPSGVDDLELLRSVRFGDGGGMLLAQRIGGLPVASCTCGSRSPARSTCPVSTVTST